MPVIFTRYHGNFSFKSYFKAFVGVVVHGWYSLLDVLGDHYVELGHTRRLGMRKLFLTRAQIS